MLYRSTLSALLVFLMTFTSASGIALDPKDNPIDIRGDDHCLVEFNKGVFEGGWICDVRAPMTHAIVQLTETVPDEETNLIFPGSREGLLEGCYASVDGDRISAPTSVTFTALGSASFTMAYAYSESIGGEATVYNVHADGTRVPVTDTITLVLPDDSASASLSWDCNEDRYVGENECDVDGVLEEDDPPARCNAAGVAYETLFSGDDEEVA